MQPQSVTISMLPTSILVLRMFIKDLIVNAVLGTIITTPYDSTADRKDWIPKTIKRTPPESAICMRMCIQNFSFTNA